MTTNGDIESVLSRAHALIDFGRHEDARALLSDAIAGAAHDARGWCLMAQAALGAGDLDQALHAARTAIELQPESGFPHRLAGIALARLGRRVEAIAVMRESVRLDPNWWLGMGQLATLLADDKETLGEARDLAQRALELAPDEPDAHFVAGVVARAEGDRAEAERFFAQVLALEPEHVGAHHELARLRLKTKWLSPGSGGRLAEAAAGFETAVRSEPRSSASRYNLDVVIRAFLARLSYFVFADAWVVGHLVGGGSTGARLVPILLLAVPAYFAIQFVGGLSPAMRSHLVMTLRRWELAIPCVAEILAVGFLLVAAASRGTSEPALGAAIAGAGIARVYLLLHSHRKSRSWHGEFGLLSDGAMWVIAGVLAFVAALMLAITPGGGVGPGVAATIFGLAFVGIVFTLFRRRARRKRFADFLA